MALLRMRKNLGFVGFRALRGPEWGLFGFGLQGLGYVTALRFVIARTWNPLNANSIGENGLSPALNECRAGDAELCH